MIHYHGTPLTPRSELQKMAGKSFCVSYAEPRDADWCLSHGQSVMWDNGAFSVFTQGKFGAPPNVEKMRDYGKDFSRWVEPRLGHPHWAVVPDIIGGDVDAQRSLIAEWPHPAQLSAPVWHMGLPIDWLLELSDHWPRICFGSSGKYWQVGSDDWARQADRAFNALSKRGPLPWVHMLRGLDLAGDKWPFSSADSVNVARNFKNKGREVCPERMARRIDARQCPIRWEPRPEQQKLFSKAW